MDLSVIVVSYNTRELLRSCLSSAYRTSQDLTLEVIVVDNASTDGSVEMVKQDFPQARVIENSSNVGFAKAANQGLQVAQGKYMLLINSDVQVRPFAFQRCIEFLQKNPKVGMVGCKLLNPDGTLQRSCESFPTLRDIVFETFFLHKLFPRSRLFGRMHLTYFGYDRVARVNYVKGAFLMTRRLTFEEVGLLDENFFFYAEEMEWCYRARQKGWEVYFIPDAEAIHRGGQSGDPISPRLFVQLHKSRYQFYRKYHGAFSSAATRGVLAIGTVLRCFGWAVLTLYRWFFQPDREPMARKKIIAFWAASRWYLGQERFQD